MSHVGRRDVEPSQEYLAEGALELTKGPLKMGKNEEPRRKRTGYQDVFYSDTPQTAGNSPLTTIKQSCPEPYQKSVYVLSA